MKVLGVSECTCGWEAHTTDDLDLANRLVPKHAQTGDMLIRQNWEETS